MPEMEIRMRRVKPLLDTQLTLASGEGGAEIAKHAHLTHATREEFIELAL